MMFLKLILRFLVPQYCLNTMTQTSFNPSGAVAVASILDDTAYRNGLVSGEAGYGGTASGLRFIPFYGGKLCLWVGNGVPVHSPFHIGDKAIDLDDGKEYRCTVIAASAGVGTWQVVQYA